MLHITTQLPLLAALCLPASESDVIAVLQGELLPPETVAQQRFGNSVALDGDRALVATDDEDVYAFERQGGVWSAPTLLDVHGTVVAIQGDQALVGQPFDDSLGTNVGLAYRLEYGPSGWSQTHVLQPPVLVEQGFFGFSLAIEEDILAVGAHASGNLFTPGKVFVSTGASGVWSDVQILEAPTPDDRDRFGYALALDSNRLAIGAPGSFGEAAYVYTLAGSSWAIEAQLTASVGFDDWFGCSIDLDGDRVAVGAFEFDNLSSSGIWEGAVFAYERIGSSWGPPQVLLAPDAAAQDRFGWDVDLEGERLLVSAYTASDLTLGGGAAYLFEQAFLGTWSLALKQTQPAPFDVAANLGYSVALSQDTILLGARGADQVADLAGAAYAFVLTPSSLGSSFCSASAACPCVPGVGSGGCLNSTGLQGMLAAAGSPSVASEFFAFRACNLPPGQGIVLAMAPQQQASHLPFGNGLLCVAGPGILRVGLRPSDHSGTATWDFSDFDGLGWLPGETRSVQAWYRDPSAVCVSTFNLSNGIELLLEP